VVLTDAAGVPPVGHAQALCHRRGRDFRLTSASVPVRRVITLAGLADRLLADVDGRTRSGGEPVAGARR
ncbi:hypothetical protein, partial [Streptomyces sp. NPDC058964]|uniref:hypothetical protein n=1 Tax=Streptomyces sp. NPDC058964 TaxID=3346681 RepID=UPI0036C26F4F